MENGLCKELLYAFSRAPFALLSIPPTLSSLVAVTGSMERKASESVNYPALLICSDDRGLDHLAPWITNNQHARIERAIADSYYDDERCQQEKRDAHTFFSQSIDHRSTCRTRRTCGIFLASSVFQSLPTLSQNSRSFTSLSERDIGLACPRFISRSERVYQITNGSVPWRHNVT
jgi:hypothetical protein